MPWMVGMWTDRAFFNSTIPLVFGSLGDKVPQSFIDDRTKLRGAPFDVGAMAAALPHHRAQFRSSMDLLEAELSARPWLLGDEVSLADVNAYMNLWYVRTNIPDSDALFEEFPRVRDWESRLKAAGHGARTDISGADAIAIAHAANARDAGDAGSARSLRPQARRPRRGRCRRAGAHRGRRRDRGALGPAHRDPPQ